VKATTTTPIVAIDLESDPIANGWASSIGRPGGNLTGFFLDLPELGGKQIELLKEAVPALSTVALLWDVTVGLTQFRVTEAAARTAGVASISLPIERMEDFTDAFKRAAREQAHAVVVLWSAVADRRPGHEDPSADDKPFHPLPPLWRSDGVRPKFP